MDICLFKDLKPTWEILPFDERLEDIPAKSKGFPYDNPLDKNLVYGFKAGADTGYVYYLPATGEVKTSGGHFGNVDELFGKKCIMAYKVADESGECVRTFICPMVIGEFFVYRSFEIKVSARRNKDNAFTCSVTPIKETERYVFSECGVITEKRDRTRVFTTVEKIRDEEIYDTAKDADAGFIQSLYRDFFRNVRIPYKNEMLNVLSHVKKGYSKFSFKIFPAIYSKAIEETGIPEDTPKRIVRELNKRIHKPYTAVRIERDLVVVTGERKSKFLDISEETREYFDKHKAYYFIKNLITGEWKADDPVEQLPQRDSLKYQVLDRDILDNTCMEEFAGHSVEKYYPGGRKINYGVVLAQVGFLSAEQAAKMDSPVFDVILRNIFEGKLKDGEKSLPELLGITGAQIKFLKDIDIPEDLEKFTECMGDAGFKEHFPDVRKRMFAVSFYLAGYRRWNKTYDVKKDEIFAGAQTICSIEKADVEKRDHLLDEYRDYIMMRRGYLIYVSQMSDDDPLRQVIHAFGEFPMNIKPSKIRDYHNRIGRLTDVLQNSGQIINYSPEIEKRYEKEARKTEYSDGKYSVLMPHDANEIINEGRMLQHCVGNAGYIRKMAEGLCTILFLRDNRDLAAPLITMEECDGSIVQCYGFRDKYNSSPEIREFIKDYASRRNLKINAVIYR